MTDSDVDLHTGLVGLAVQLRRMIDGAAFVKDGFVRVLDPHYLVTRIEQAAARIESLSAQVEALTRERDEWRDKAEDIQHSGQPLLWSARYSEAVDEIRHERDRADAAEARVRELVTTGTALLDKLSLEDDEGLLEHAEPVIRFRTALRNQNKDGDK